MNTRSNSTFFSFTFTLLSIIGGCGIVFVSICAGGIYSAFVEPDNAKITPDVLAQAILAGFITYQITIGILMIYMVRMGGISWRLRFSMFVLTPLAIYFLRGVLPLAMSLFLLMAIAALAVYQSLVIHYCSHQARRIRG